jgi:subfamily B ATP-binding cassette protein MsbA
MKDAFKLFRKYLPPYKGYVIATVIFNILGAIFGIFSFVALIPILKILFNLESKVYTYVETGFSIFPLNIPREALINNMYAWLQINSEKFGAVHLLVIVGLITIFMILLKNTFTYLGSFTMTKIRNHVVKDIRNKLFARIVSLPIGFFTDERKGDIIARATGDVNEVENSIMTSLDIVFKNPVIIFFTLLFMIFMSWQLTLFVFIIFPIAGGIIGVIGKTLRKQSRRGQAKMGEILSTIEQALGGLRIIKAFNAEEKIKKTQQKQNQEYRFIMDKITLRRALASPLSEFLGTVLVIAVMWYGGRLILLGEGKSSLEPDIFIGYLALFYNIINPTKAFSTAFYNIQKGLASMERIDAILNTRSNIIVKNNALRVSSFENQIEYKDVWFRYKEEYVLQNINISVKKGQTIALVGASGSGKSTFTDLLPRFYDVSKGSIAIDGNDIRDLDIKGLRSLMGIVNQEPILFNDTIYNNIAFGVDAANSEEVERAARIANAHEFIIKTEDGYNTNVGDRGGRLSGGQRQRISIARAVLTNPPIMILDEATSSLDTESERLVQEAIGNLMKERTSIVIAHRLSTVRTVDTIFVLNEGRVVEQGSYNELLSKNGIFKVLHDNQFSA